MAIIEVENVNKRFRSARGVRALLGRGGLPDLVRGRRAEEVTALEGITFSVDPGESVGLIGANGSGKSTLLKIIAGVTVPTEGSVRVYGRVASLLELGAGFHPLLSGRENVYLNAGIYGMRRAQVDAIFDCIAEFSGIGKFIDFPVATYSSGMYVRLGFAVAAHVNPDIFLIDEVLAVGDEEFQRKCRRRIGELIEQGKTMLFVSHDLAIINVLCRRVILLNRGRLIARDTPAKAIDFYLRQIGAPKGIHTLKQGPAEVVLCNGRISLYYRQEEITSPLGFRTQVSRLGGWRGSQDAEWTLTEVSETRCVARGYDAKLGLTHVWELGFDGGDFVWSVAYECAQPLDVEMLEATLFFGMAYTGWMYGEASGGFHDIVPDDTTWAPMMAAEILPEAAGILAADEQRQPSVSMTFENTGPLALGNWQNTDYLSKSRVFRLEERLGKGEALPSGTRKSFCFRFNLGSGRKEIERRSREQGLRRTVVSGRLQARFKRGQFEILYDDRLITTGVHGYASLLIQGLWNDSSNLRWERLERDGEALRAIGASRRFPFRMHWSIFPKSPGAIAWTIDLEALEDLDVQEYQASVLLVEEYARWTTATESGEFPPIRADDDDWVHLNRDYAVGSSVRAEGPGLPAVTLRNDEVDIPLRMTALNTGFHQRARVLQALRAADHGLIHFPRGTHQIFAGEIVVVPAGE